MRLHDATGDEEPEPSAAWVAVLPPHERVEDLLLFPLRKSGTVVPNLHRNHTICGLNGDRNVGLRRGIRQGVSNQVPDGSSKMAGVGPNHDALRGRDGHAVVPGSGIT